MSVTLAIILILGTAVGTAHGVLTSKESERKKLAERFADDLRDARVNAAAATRRDTDPSVVLESGSEEVKQRIVTEGRYFYGNE
jgi:hypothetical protein